MLFPYGIKLVKKRTDASNTDTTNLSKLCSKKS